MRFDVRKRPAFPRMRFDLHISRRMLAAAAKAELDAPRPCATAREDSTLRS